MPGGLGPRELDTTGCSGSARRLVLVLDQEPARLEATARDVQKLVPDARVLVLDATTRGSPRGVRDADTDPPPDVLLVAAYPGGWAAASVLAAHRPPYLGRPVDAFLVAEGPLENFPVLITDFPGLRLLPPDVDTATVVAGLIHGDCGEAR
jgi:hypothetical protein